MSDERLERVARALFAVDRSYAWDDASGPLQREYYKRAKAVLAELAGEQSNG